MCHCTEQVNSDDLLVVFNQGQRTDLCAAVCWRWVALWTEAAEPGLVCCVRCRLNATKLNAYKTQRKKFAIYE